MKNVNFLKAMLFVIAFTSFTATTFSVPTTPKAPVKQKSIQSEDFDMWLTNTAEDLIVNYINPRSENLQVVVYDIYGNPIATEIIYDAEGRVAFSLAVLEAKGGTGTYTVSLTSSDGTSSKKGTIVIIRY